MICRIFDTPFWGVIPKWATVSSCVNVDKQVSTLIWICVRSSGKNVPIRREKKEEEKEEEDVPPF